MTSMPTSFTARCNTVSSGIPGANRDKSGKEKMKAYKDEPSAAEINDLVAYTRHYKK